MVFSNTSFGKIKIKKKKIQVESLFNCSKIKHDVGSTLLNILRNLIPAPVIRSNRNKIML